MQDFPAPVAFDNSHLNRMTLIICLVSVVTAGLFYINGIHNPYAVLPAAVTAITLGIYIYRRLSRKSAFTSLSDRIHYQSVLHDYGLEETPVRAKAQGLANRFQAFRLGNHSRELKKLLHGRYHGDEHEFTYDYYHFHYVNRRTETYTTTDSKGNVRVRTRTVYDHFDRFGFIVAFQFAKNLRISESGLSFFNKGWKSSSVSFNKNFNVRADSEMEAAKFLTPKLILEIEAAGKALTGLDMEFNSAGDLCFSFDDRNTLAKGRMHGLENPVDFEREIAGHSSQPKLDSALEFIHTLMKYSDNNFEHPTRSR